MELNDLIIDYTSADFAGAVRQLLPRGEYWQESENAELANLIDGMGAEFKTIHDECQLSLLTEMRDELFGWRISDYQALLYTFTSGTVFDEKSTPNLIYVRLDHRDENTHKAWAEFERKRLPHTRINWILNTEQAVVANIAATRHIKKRTQYFL